MIINSALAAIRNALVRINHRINPSAARREREISDGIQEVQIMVVQIDNVGLQRLIGSVSSSPTPSEVGDVLSDAIERLNRYAEGQDELAEVANESRDEHVHLSTYGSLLEHEDEEPPVAFGGESAPPIRQARLSVASSSDISEIGVSDKDTAAAELGGVHFECPICLERPDSLKNAAAIDCCDHQYCFGCIDEWAKREPKCPLCKETFTAIISSDGVQRRVDHRLMRGQILIARLDAHGRLSALER